MCKGVNIGADLKIKAIVDKVWGSHDAAQKGGFNPSEHLSYTEYFCHHESTFLGQLACVFLFLTVLKTIIPRAREAGEKARQVREANAMKLV
jgi:hypothetical protein